MKFRHTPWTHIGYTAEEITTTVGPSNIEVTVPVKTKCILLEGPGKNNWVVDDLWFIPGGKSSMLHHDADHYGIRIPFEKITDVRPKP